ncbi:MAG: Rab family GTPase [Candidatus Heimdallarchaeaceae archaeon]
MIERSYKVSLVGDPSVGKTSIALRQAHGAFPEEHSPTLGSNILIWNTVYKNVKIKLVIADTGSQEKFKYVLPSYFKNSLAAAVIFDITNRRTYENTKKWISLLKQSIGPIPFIIVGNKIDLEDMRQVSLEDGEYLAKQYNTEYIEVSAKMSENLNNMFNKLVELAYSQDKTMEQ